MKRHILAFCLTGIMSMPVHAREQHALLRAPAVASMSELAAHMHSLPAALSTPTNDNDYDIHSGAVDVLAQSGIPSRVNTADRLVQDVRDGVGALGGRVLSLRKDGTMEVLAPQEALPAIETFVRAQDELMSKQVSMTATMLRVTVADAVAMDRLRGLLHAGIVDIERIGRIGHVDVPHFFTVTTLNGLSVSVELTNKRDYPIQISSDLQATSHGLEGFITSGYTAQLLPVVHGDDVTVKMSLRVIDTVDGHNGTFTVKETEKLVQQVNVTRGRPSVLWQSRGNVADVMLLNAVAHQ